MQLQNISTFFLKKSSFGFFRPTREFFTFFTHMETSTGEGLHILTYARHIWPLSSEGSLACHAYEKRGICSQWSLKPIAERLAVMLSLPVLRVRSVAAGIRLPNLPFAGRTL